MSNYFILLHPKNEMSVPRNFFGLFKKRPKKKLKDKEECPICLDRLGTGGKIVTTNCGHSFCKNCLKSIYRPICPCCRTPLDGVSQRITRTIKQNEEKNPFWCYYPETFHDPPNQNLEQEQDQDLEADEEALQIEYDQEDELVMLKEYYLSEIYNFLENNPQLHEELFGQKI